MIRLGLGVLEMTLDVMCHSHRISHQHDITIYAELGHLAEVVSGHFPHCTSPPLFRAAVSKELSACSPRLRSGELRYVNCWKSSCVGNLSVLLHVFIYPIVYLHRCGLVGILYFVLYDNTLLLCSSSCPNVATGSPFSWLLCPCHVCPHHCVLVSVFPLLSGTLR